MARPRVDEDLALRILSDAADFADEQIERRLQEVGVCAASDAPNARTAAATDALSVGVITVSYCALVFMACGLSRIFCERQSLISAVKMTFGSRQSIWWIVANSPGPLPAFPNLPMIVPSSSI